MTSSPPRETRTLTDILPTCPSSRPLYQFGYRRKTRFILADRPLLPARAHLLVWRWTGFEPAKAKANGFTDRSAVRISSRESPSRTELNGFGDRRNNRYTNSLNIARDGFEPPNTRVRVVCLTNLANGQKT